MYYFMCLIRAGDFQFTEHFALHRRLQHDYQNLKAFAEILALRQQGVHP
jgi:hypothetical protein